jgi:hypothetical protein
LRTRVGLVAFAITLLAAAAVGCGGGVPNAINDYVKERYPRGKLLGCEKTDRIVAGARVWNCGVRRRHESEGPYADELNRIEDTIRPPLELCLVVHDGRAQTLSGSCG